MGATNQLHTAMNPTYLDIGITVLSGAERTRLSRRLAGRRPAGRRRRATRSREDGDSTANRRSARGVGSLLKQSAL